MARKKPTYLKEEAEFRAKQKQMRKEIVLGFIKENPEQSLWSVSNRFGVGYATLQNWLRDE